MDKALFERTVLNDEYAGHLEAIPQLRSNAVAIEYARRKTAYPGLQSKELIEGTFHEAESGVKDTVRITDMLRSLQVVALEIPLSDFVLGHVYKDDARSRLFDAIPFAGNV